MKKIKNGDIVSIKSYKSKMLFSVEDIIKNYGSNQIAIHKGRTVRIVVEAHIDDLILIDNKDIYEFLSSLDARIDERINNFLKMVN